MFVITFSSNVAIHYLYLVMSSDNDIVLPCYFTLTWTQWIIGNLQRKCDLALCFSALVNAGENENSFMWLSHNVILYSVTVTDIFVKSVFICICPLDGSLTENPHFQSNCRSLISNMIWCKKLESVIDFFFQTFTYLLNRWSTTKRTFSLKTPTFHAYIFTINPLQTFGDK